MAKQIFIAFVFFIAGAIGVAAEDKTDASPLTLDQAERFVATLPAVNALGASFEEEGKIEQLKIQNTPVPEKKFAPYSNAVSVMAEKYPDDLDRLNSVIAGQDFNATEWSHVGDRVMIAYLALKMEENDPDTMAMMEGFDESMLEMMPPEMHDQLAHTFVMMETVKNAPEADKLVVADIKDDLDAVLDAQAEN